MAILKQREGKDNGERKTRKINEYRFSDSMVAKNVLNNPNAAKK